MAERSSIVIGVAGGIVQSGALLAEQGGGGVTAAGVVRVVLDAGPAVHQTAGLARYAERLARHVARDHGERVELSLLYNAHSGHLPPPSLAALPRRTLSLGQYAWRLGTLASQMARLPLDRWLLSPGAVYHATEHLLPRLAAPTLLTVHDLIFERFPQHHTRTNRLFLRLAMPLFVRAADAIIAVSAQTRRDLIDRYATAGEKIHVIYEGVDDTFRPASPDAVNQVRRAHDIRGPYLLMVGTLEPRKNHVLALEGLARLRRQGYAHQLVIVGEKGWLYAPIFRSVVEMGLEEGVLFTGRVPDDHLAPLYSGADCFLMPSLYEGFGFPVLEAMACGTPVVCSRTSSLPEVAGDAALLVDPEDVDDLVQAVERVIRGGEEADRMRERGLAQLRRFRWERCAAETVRLYAALATRTR